METSTDAMRTQPDHNPNPILDSVFRKLFGSEENKDLLISLINGIAEPHLHVADVVIKSPIDLAAYEGAKESIVDIRAQDQNGTWYIIEMQLHGHTFYGKRAIYYAARTYVDQLETGQEFVDLNATIGIHLLDFNLFPDERIVRQFALQDTETGEEPKELEYLQLYFVELGKFRKEWSEINTLCDRWIAFLKRGKNLHQRSLPAVLQEEPAIAKAVSVLERMGADPVLRAIFEAEEKQRMATAAELEFAEQQGIQEGVRRERKRLVLHLMTRHIGPVPDSVAVRLDALTPDRLDEFAEALFDLNSYADIEAWIAAHP